MFNLAKFIELDGFATSGLGLASCLGDRFLCRMNPVYLTIREKALSSGFLFVSDDHPLARQYRAVPLFCLKDIMDNSSIPYLANADACRRLVEQNGNFQVNATQFLQLIKPNYILHETAHCIAAALLDDILPASEERGTISFVMRTLISEAFANVVEKVAWSYADTESHMYLFALNSYGAGSPEQQTDMLSARTTWGLRTLMALGFATYCFYNTQLKEDRPYAIDYLRAVGFSYLLSSPAHRALLDRLTNDSFYLSLAFRRETSSAYFRFYGCEDIFLRLCDGATNVSLASEQIVDALVGDLSDQIGRAHRASLAESPFCSQVIGN